MYRISNTSSDELFGPTIYFLYRNTQYFAAQLGMWLKDVSCQAKSPRGIVISRCQIIGVDRLM